MATTSALADAVLTGFSTWHELIELRPQAPLEFIDFTDRVKDVVQRSGLVNGFVNVQTRHTTTAILVGENEPLLLEDLKRMLEKVAPCSATYRHDDFTTRTVNMCPDEERNGHSHCKALLLRASETLNLVQGELQLGRWQRIFLIELDRGRTRTVSVLVLGERR